MSTINLCIHEPEAPVYEWSKHGEPPPHEGWWNASVSKNKRAWRWWDGVAWSQVVFEEQSDVAAARAASTYANQYKQDKIRWTRYWPDNARVFRLDPRLIGKPAMPNISIELGRHPVKVRTHTTMEEALVAAEGYIAACVDRDGRMRPQDCRTLCLVRHALGRDIVTGRPL